MYVLNAGNLRSSIFKRISRFSARPQGGKPEKLGVRLCWAGPAGLGRLGFEIGSAGLGSAVPPKSLLGWAASAARDGFGVTFGRKWLRLGCRDLH